MFSKKFFSKIFPIFTETFFCKVFFKGVILLWQFHFRVKISRFPGLGFESQSRQFYVMTRMTTHIDQSIKLLRKMFFVGLTVAESWGKEKSGKHCLVWGSNPRPGKTWNWNCHSTLWRKRGKAPYDAYCLTQCSNGCSLGSFLFPRQENFVQKCVSNFELMVFECGQCSVQKNVPKNAETSKNFLSLNLSTIFGQWVPEFSAFISFQIHRLINRTGPNFLVNFHGMEFKNKFLSSQFPGQNSDILNQSNVQYILIKSNGMQTFHVSMSDTTQKVGKKDSSK